MLSVCVAVYGVFLSGSSADPYWLTRVGYRGSQFAAFGRPSCRIISYNILPGLAA